MSLIVVGIVTVFRLNILEQKLKRSSKLGPRSSMTKTLHFPTRDNRDFGNRDCSNERRLLHTLYGRLKIATEDSGRVGLSEYLC